MYPLSPAAAKGVGQDPGPDLRIRDSYNTKTLIPLAKPPSGFRKNGIVALASARGAGKYHGGQSFGPRPPNGHGNHNAARLPDEIQFCSNPPGYSNGEENSTKEEPINPKLKLAGEEIVKIDEETRDVVPTSLYGVRSPN
ncbi:uncharacterized protein Z518_05586 [Rhinocladiella mackenziei CBS 650.93]|uniref:Uncharacterized protein n=1 Tax=Rhinocladiella mackenziei CBS 650.93 TaxID=1442369 RepID=A0A0D2INJ7_9EURO|nr:uncharacterized protein Z518_05586 [Rhinocladiella mackenziei CBS 650.93]KIX04716.1 hypothetical protein Z518_05586 [Rhinocladiella mackenziei CBS 650.93]